MRTSFRLRHFKRGEYRHLLRLTLLTAIPLVASAQLLDYGPFAGYGLRKGILGNQFAVPMAACITGKETPLEASRSGVRASITYSTEEYKRAFHIDQNAEASFLGIAGGGEEVHFGQETGRSGSAFDIIVEAYSEHNSRTVDNVVWDEPYKTLVRSGDPAKVAEVRESCGDRYIQTVFYETRIFAVLRVSDRNAASLMAFRGRATGSVGIDIVSASAALGGDLNVSSANRQGALAIDIYTEGLGGIVPTAGLIGITAEDGLQNISKKLAAYLANLKDLGQPVKYKLSPYPDMPIPHLSDSRIFEYLNGLKSTYASVSARHGNVKALQRGDEPRRIVLRLPQADEALKQQERRLESYLNGVAETHEACRRAATLEACTKSLGELGDPPSVVSVELPSREAAVSLSSFLFFINGKPVPAGQGSLLISQLKPTVLEVAKMLNPEANTVDVMATINSPYIASLDIDILEPRVFGRPVSAHRLLGQELMVADSLATAEGREARLPILHADAQHPCRITRASGTLTLEPDCLTIQGRVLRGVALANAAEFVKALDRPLPKQPPVLDGALVVGTVTTCFSEQYRIGIAGFHLEVSSTDDDRIKVRTELNVRTSDTPQFTTGTGIGSVFPLAVPSPGPVGSLGQPAGGIAGFGQAFAHLSLAVAEETHSKKEWLELANDRLLRSVPMAALGVNPCGPRLP